MMKDKCPTCKHSKTLWQCSLDNKLHSELGGCSFDYEFEPNEFIATVRNLLSFCNDLTDEEIANNALERYPTHEECMYIAKRYRELADQLKKFGVEL